MTENVPPGRAGRLWLADRLRHARRALDLLDRKRQILRSRVRVATEVRDRVEADWRRACVRARDAAMAADAGAGVWAVDLASGPVRDRARLEVEQTETVGVRHPGRARMELPELPAAYAAACGPAVRAAAEAHGAALRAAADLAVAERTRVLLAAELALTERRYRSIDRIRLPALEQQLRSLTLRLDELERQERVTTRWASGRVLDGGEGPGP